MNFSFFDRFLCLRIFLPGMFIFLGYNLMAQNCSLTNTIQHQVNNGCDEQNNGQIVLTFDQSVEGIIDNKIALYLKDQKVFFRNRVNTSDLKIEGRNISYDNLPSGVYQIAIYFEDCPDFPKPTMYPSEGIIVANDQNCRQ